MRLKVGGLKINSPDVTLKRRKLNDRIDTAKQIKA
jgi:hypothetical protein